MLRNGVMLRTNRNIFSVECGIVYHTPKTSIAYQTLFPPLFYGCIFSPLAMKLCPSASNLNYLKWLPF